MALYGTLHTMPLPELLNWVFGNKKTGVLELERNQICKRVMFRDGHVVACSSDDPGARFGQHLLSQGKIDELQLSEALSRQGTSGKNLGAILREMGALTVDEERRQLAHKAEENIYSLFDWLDAAFRFREDDVRDPYGIDVDISVEDVIFKGMQRREELDNIREVFDSSGLVLRKTVKPVPSNVRNSARAMLILDLVDGQRTLAELLLHAHATEHTVVKFLFTLYRMGVVEVSGVRPVTREFVSILDDQPVEDPSPAGGADLPAVMEDPLFAGDPMALESDGVDELGPGGAPAPRPNLDDSPFLDRQANDDDPSSSDLPHGSQPARQQSMPQPAPQPEAPRQPALQAAVEMMNLGHFAGALDLLSGCYQQQPNDESLRQLMLRAEGAYLQDVRNGELRGYRIPIVTPPADISALSLEPVELFLLNTIDGVKDIQSILWVTPQREVEVMRALEKLNVKGLIRLTDPQSHEPSREPQLETVEPGALDWDLD